MMAIGVLKAWALSSARRRMLSAVWPSVATSRSNSTATPSSSAISFCSAKPLLGAAAQPQDARQALEAHDAAADEQEDEQGQSGKAEIDAGGKLHLEAPPIGRAECRTQQIVDRDRRR